MVFYFSYFFWNPNREFFRIPIIHWPVYWYSLFFVFGFFVGFMLFKYELKNFLFHFFYFSKKDLLDEESLMNDFKNPKNEKQKKIAKLMSYKFSLGKLNEFIQKELFSDVIPFKNFSFLKNRTLHFKKTASKLYIEQVFSSSLLSTKKKADLISDKLLIYVLIATVVGARLGHLIFYEQPSYYLLNPIKIIAIWEGGLASHGAAVAILIALTFFLRYLKRYSPPIDFINLLDLIAMPVSFAGFCIRIGNFFNQEILGRPTNLPWGIIFGSEGMMPLHPVQLYEAFFYLSVFFLLFFMNKKKFLFLQKGKNIGLFLIFVFGFRFFIEFLKEKQSEILSQNTYFLMGQYLSVPFIFLGIFFFFYELIFFRKIRR